MLWERTAVHSNILPQETCQYFQEQWCQELSIEFAPKEMGISERAVACGLISELSMDWPMCILY